MAMKKKKPAHPFSFQEICRQSCQLVCTDAILTVDREGSLCTFNRGAQELFGYPAGDVVGRPFAELLRQGQSGVATIWLRLEQGEPVQIFETEMLDSENRPLAVQLSASLLTDGKGERAGFVAICHDLSPLRTLESAIRQKDQFFGAILKNSADAILTLDPGDRITSWNKGAEAIFGYSEEEMLGKSLDVVLPVRLKEQKELEKISEMARSQGHLQSYQTQRLTKDGRLIDVVFTRSAIRDNQGTLIGFSSIVRDITEERLIARHMAQTEKLSAIGELAAGLAHEIKNPLAGIKGAIEIIRDTMPEQNAHRGVLGEVLSEVARIDRIVLDLLSYAKPKAPDFHPLDLLVLVGNVLAFTKKMADAKSIRMGFQHPESLAPIMGDENDLRQLILNLLLNALDAVPEKGEIQVGLQQTADARILIEIRDNGPGIPTDRLKKIFAPFYTTKKKGTGLGLATCRRIVTEHGGEIRCVSEAGQGARFLVEFPLHNHVPMSLAVR